MTYELIVRSRTGRENFRAIFYNENKKIYYRVKYDRFDYEEMIEQFLERGSIRVKKGDDGDYEIDRRTFSNVEEIGEYLENSGFNVVINKIEDDFAPVSFVFDGRDINPAVISIKENDKLLRFTNAAFQYANNVDYSPKFNERASSFAIDIQENDIRTGNIEKFFDDLKKCRFDTDEYFRNTRYRKLVKALEELLEIKTLSTFKIAIQGKKNPIEIPLDSIGKFLKKAAESIKKRPFEKSFRSSALRAFDAKNRSAKVDMKSVYTLHFANVEIFDTVKKASESAEEKTITPKNSYFKATKTIQINEVSIK